MNIYDLHVHTKYSACSNNNPQLVLKRLKKLGYSGVAITDHHTIKGGLAVKRLNKDKDFEVIVSSEIKTANGEFLVYYLQEEIKARDFLEVVDQARSQDAIISIAHPFGLGYRQILKGHINDVLQKIDAIETFNSRVFFPSENKKAELVAKQFDMPGTAGSDAHFLFELGGARTVFDGSLRSAIKYCKTKTYGITTRGPPGGLCSAIPKYFMLKGFNKKYK